MCTSFVYRGNDTVIAMNYDNYGNNLQLAPYNPELFLVTAKLNGKACPLFGIRSDGIFVNQQLVPQCKGGEFREGEAVIHTIDFVDKVLLGQVDVSKMDKYLAEHEIVSPPDHMCLTEGFDISQFHIHTLLADIAGDSYIIEPGRGNLKFSIDEKYITMSNCSLYEARKTGQYEGFGADRQIKLESILSAADDSFSVADAFEALKAVHMLEYRGYCSTEFSFVYSARENAVYYCYNREFNRISKYQMEARL